MVQRLGEKTERDTEIFEDEIHFTVETTRRIVLLKYFDGALFATIRKRATIEIPWRETILFECSVNV